MEKVDIGRSLDIYINTLNKEEVNNFKQIVGIDIKEILLELILTISEHNGTLGKINMSFDNYDSYIFKPDNEGYDIETFLLNRLFRNVSNIKIEEQFFSSASEYKPDVREIEFDKQRIIRLKEANRDDQVKKLIVHEILHSLKSVPYKSDFFESNKYCELKKLLQHNGIENINDFNEEKFIGGGIYRNHISTGIEYNFIGQKLYPHYEKFDKRFENVDEIFNEIDSIIFSEIQMVSSLAIDDDNFIAVRNPDSSNVYITNYGNIVKQLVGKEIWFYGQYLKPEILVEFFNRMYGEVFQRYNFSNEDGFYIFVKMIDEIKANPTNANMHSRLLECLYECMNIKNTLFSEQTIKPQFFRANGLLNRGINGVITSLNLPYADELESNINLSAIKK